MNTATKVTNINQILERWKSISETDIDPRDLTPEARYKDGYQAALRRAHEEILQAIEPEA